MVLSYDLLTDRCVMTSPLTNFYITQIYYTLQCTFKYIKGNIKMWLENQQHTLLHFLRHFFVFTTF